MVRYLFRLSYVGTKYRGIQKTPECINETIQDIIESALSTIKLLEPPVAHFASRTDKGVHAVMNAFHADLDHKLSGEVYLPSSIKSKINSFLVENKHEILITNVSIVPNHFHCRYHARWRSYFYRLAVLKSSLKNVPLDKFSSLSYLPMCEINRCHVVPSELNTSVVKHVADLFRGEHDFSSFTKYVKREPWRNYRRDIEECKFYRVNCPSTIEDPQYRNIDIWEFYVKSQSFLFHQVRKLVGAALSAGLGTISLPDIQFMLQNPDPSNWLKCRLPPAGGLYLAHIEYDKKDFASNSVEENFNRTGGMEL